MDDNFRSKLEKLLNATVTQNLLCHPNNEQVVTGQFEVSEWMKQETVRRSSIEIF